MKMYLVVMSVSNRTLVVCGSRQIALNWIEKRYPDVRSIGPDCFEVPTNDGNRLLKIREMEVVE